LAGDASPGNLPIAKDSAGIGGESAIAVPADRAI
jgi:hypothetical protein